MWKASLKSLFAHKARLALTALAIVLGVAFVSGTYIYTDTTNRAFDSIFDEAFVGIDIVVAGDSTFQFGQGIYFEESLVADIAAVDGVAEVIPTLTGFGPKIIDRDGEPIGGQGPPQFAAALTGSEVGTGGFELRGESRPPMGGDEIVIDAASADTAGYEIGDTVPVEFPTIGTREFTLVGIAGFGEADNIGGATFALFDLETTQEVLEREGQLDGAFVQAEPGTDIETLVAAVGQVLPEGARAQSSQEAAEEQAAEIQEGLSFFGTFLLVFAFVALFVATFLIYNTFRIVVAQRLRELALLRAVGATRRQVLWSVLFEALVVGVIASVIGIAAGAGLAIALRAALEQFGIALPSAALVFAPRTLVVGLIVGVVVTLVSAIVPAIGASRVPPVAAMREEMARPKRKTLTRRAIFGAVLGVVGVALMFAGLLGDYDGATVPLSLIGAGAAVIILAAYVFSALVADPMARTIGAPLAKAFGAAGKLAQRNAGRSPRRTAATASAIMVGIALISMVTLLSASIRGTVDAIFDTGVDADVVVTSTDQFAISGFTADLAEEAAGLEEVAALTRIQAGAIIVDGTETFAGSLEPNFEDFFSVESIEGTAAISDDGVLVGSSEAESNDWSVGDVVAIEFEQSGVQELTVEGIITSDTITGYSLSRDRFTSEFGSDADSQVYIQSATGFTAEETRDAVAALAADIPSANVQTNEELVDEIGDQVNQILGLITGLLAMTVLIALIGVTNTMALAVIERTREIGLLRAVGLNRRQTRRMIRVEASIVSVFGAILGVGLGIFFGWAILQPLRDEGFTEFVIPFGGLALWIAIAGVLGVVFALWPAWRASRLNVLEAISYE